MATDAGDLCHCRLLEQSKEHVRERGPSDNERANDMDQDRSHLDNSVRDEPTVAITAPTGDAAADIQDISTEAPASVGLDDKTTYDGSQKETDLEKKPTGSLSVAASETKNENSDSQNEHCKDQTKKQRATVESEDEHDNAPKGKEKGEGKAGVILDFTDHKAVEKLLEMVALRNAKYKPTPNATEDELAEERRRVLADPKTRHRSVFSAWPRDPASKKLISPEETVQGKTAPNGVYLWGATLFDFYYVQRQASFEQLQTVTTGSKMLQWLKILDEEKYPGAMHLVRHAEKEKDPEVIEPCCIRRLIIGGEAARRDACLLMGKRGEEPEIMFPRTYPIDSIFTADTYPKGWARKPFSESFAFPVSKPPTLQQYIPQHLLPQKLVVHDPCNLLLADEYRRERQPRDVNHTYKLSPSTTHTDHREADERAQVEQEAKEKAIRDKFLADPHSRNTLPDGLVLKRGDKPEPGPVRPYVYYVFPPSVKPQQVQEAHLYLDMRHVMGSGHHSYVYSAVLELPRTFLVPPEVCQSCIEEDAAEQLKTIINPDGSSIDPRFDEKTGMLVLKEVVEEPIVASTDDTSPLCPLDPGCEERGLVYEGPYLVLQSRVQPQNLEEGPYCEHRRKNEMHPLTTRVTVAAKVSIQGDHHLPREAQSYQRFPRHFFEHWSGYNIIPPIHYPFSIGPLVPQFYGYYELDEEAEVAASKSGVKPYLSPILLLEDCGTQIEPEELSVDDKNECASLLYRFNFSKWAHQSIYSRNILVQKGPLSEWPVERMVGSWLDGRKTNSFRLIDFGRSVYADDLQERERENTFKDEKKKIDDWYFGYKSLLW